MGFLVLRSSRSAGGSEPAFGDRAIGVNESTQDATATTIILDARQDFTGSSLLWLTDSAFRVRLPGYTHQPTGGYWGTGGCKFVPGYFTGDEANDPKMQHVGGFGQIHAFDDVVGGSGCRQIAVGMLFRFGSGWLSEQDGDKEIILLRSGDAPGGGRPMIVPKWNASSGDIIFPACDDEMCNCSRDPADNEFGNDGPNPFFNYEDYYDEWAWIELRCDMDAGWSRTYISTADGVHNGTFMTEQDYLSSGTDGSFSGLDNINFLNSVQTPTAACYKEMCWIEFRLGSSAAITPPTGFPGSAR